jgi:hypothetical protein
VKLKTSELQGETLDRMVAKCEGIEVRQVEGVLVDPLGLQFSPSIDWSYGGMVIEREKIGVWWATHYVDEDGVEYGNHWYAEVGCTDENADSRYCGVADGPTPLIAAMRCYVASKLGDEVEVPDESST